MNVKGECMLPYSTQFFFVRSIPSFEQKQTTRARVSLEFDKIKDSEVGSKPTKHAIDDDTISKANVTTKTSRNVMTTEVNAFRKKLLSYKLRAAIAANDQVRMRVVKETLHNIKYDTKKGVIHPTRLVMQIQKCVNKNSKIEETLDSMASNHLDRWLQEARVTDDLEGVRS